MQFINLRKQYQRIEHDIKERINTVLSHGKYILGPEIPALETVLNDYIGSQHCIAVSSGTDALLLSLMALGIGPGDEVITSAFSFFASSEVICLLGAKPVFVDISSDTYNLDPNQIEKLITDKTKAIMTVSLYGQCADMDAINALASKYKLKVIEDAAQSFGASYHGRKSCNLSDVSCTSFFPSKPLGAYGDGGACFTNDEDMASRIRALSVHGQTARYHHEHIGLNARMDSMQAAVLLAKFALFEEEVGLRQQVAKRYHDLLEGVVELPFIAPYNVSVYAQYTIMVDDRDGLAAHLNQHSIPTAIHYPIPLPYQKALAYLDHKPGDFPVTDKAASRVLSLPFSPYLEADDQKTIAKQIKAYVK